MADSEPVHAVVLDADSQRWLDGLHADGTRRQRCIDELYALLLHSARHETGRRRDWLGGASGLELDDLAHQASGDALLAIIDKLDTYRGASRFTTWAYMFVVHQVSLKMRRHLWSGWRVAFDDADWDRLPDRLSTRPDRQSEQRAQLAALRAAVDGVLTARQRHVFIAVALNEVPIDVVAQRLDANRGAIYKTLHDARRKLRAALATAGFPLGAPPHNP